MNASPLDGLAEQLRRPSSTLVALQALSDEQVRHLSRVIEDASTRQRDEVRASLRRALPAPLRRLVLGARWDHT